MTLGQSGVPDHVVLYDARCGMCNRWVRWVIRVQLTQGVKRVYVAPLGGAVSQQLGNWPPSHDQVVYVGLGEVAEGSTAVLRLLTTLLGPRWWLTWAFRMPRRWRDGVYGWVAGLRHWVQTCQPLTPTERGYYLD